MSIEAWLDGVGARESSGGEWILECPFCGKTGHLYVNSEDRDRGTHILKAGRWICFKCGEAGTLPRLYAEVEGVSLDEAKSAYGLLRMPRPTWRRPSLMRRATAEARPQPTERKPRPKPKVAAPVDAVPEWLPREFEPVWDGSRWHWPSYLTDRAMPREQARQMGIGFCREGEWGARIIFPIDCPNGQSFTGRSVIKSESLRYKSGPNAGGLLFGWDSAKDSDWAVLTEGPFDTARVIEAGNPALGLLGKQVRDAQRKMLGRFKRFVLMLDPEALEDALRVEMGGTAVEIRVATLPKDDPSGSTVEVVNQAISDAVLLQDAMRGHVQERLRRIRRSHT